jgi:CDP-diacylglycerol---glycerol-3-phosphate 3-phosphatidyltransferase
MQHAIKDDARRLLDPGVALLARLKVHPTAVSLAGLLLSAISGFLVAGGRLRPGAACLILAALCDVLDGQLARRTGQSSRFGAFLDSCLDRLGEGAVFLGLAIYFGPLGPRWVAVAILALLCSTMVSYARARAEGLGLDGKAGFLERPERLVMLIAGLLIGGLGLRVLLIALTILAAWTFLARVRHVGKQVGAVGSQSEIMGSSPMARPGRPATVTGTVKEMKVDG